MAKIKFSNREALIYVFIFVFFSFTPITAFSLQDPWDGEYVSNKIGQTEVVSSIVLSKNGQFHYLAKVRMKSFIEDSKKKSHFLQGEAQMFSSGNDKDATNRLLITFPKNQDAPFFEIFPGVKSSPVRNAQGFRTIRYTYFETTSGLYVSGELIRKHK